MAEEGVLVKVADKIANVRDVANNPHKHWSQARRVDYLEWAEQLVDSCPNVDPGYKNASMNHLYLLASFLASANLGETLIVCVPQTGWNT